MVLRSAAIADGESGPGSRAQVGVLDVHRARLEQIQRLGVIRLYLTRATVLADLGHIRSFLDEWTQRPPARLTLAGGEPVVVLGSVHYQKHLHALAQSLTNDGDPTCWPLIAGLVHRSADGASGGSITVEVAGKPVGFLRREKAADCREMIGKLAEDGMEARCGARIAADPVLPGQLEVILDLGWPLRRT
jgi:hypothetical protein